MALPTCSQAWVRRPSIKAALSWLIQEPEICRRSSSLSSSTITSHQDQLPFIKILKDGFSVHYTNLPMVAVTFIFCIDRVSMYKVFMGSMYNVSCYLKYTYLYLEISNVMVVFKKWHVISTVLCLAPSNTELNLSGIGVVHLISFFLRFKSYANFRCDQMLSRFMYQLLYIWIVN